MEIRSIIREILTQNDFVSLPGIGSFIQKYESAKLSADSSMFYPPKQTVTFDTTRIFNDEAIENYICKSTGVNHTIASAQLSEFITLIREDLNKGVEVNFPNVGSLKKDTSGNITFKPALADELASALFGLNAVDTGIKVDKTATDKSVKPPVKHIETKKVKKLKTGSIITISLIGVFLLIVILFALIPDIRFWQLPPVSENEVIAHATEVQKTDIEKPVEMPQQVDSTVNQTIESKTDKKAALYYEEPKVQDNKTYYIIAGSFGVLENAQKLSESFKQKGFTPEILQGESMYRVSIYKTTDRNVALNELSKLRNSKPSEKFWLLGL